MSLMTRLSSRNRSESSSFRSTWNSERSKYEGDAKDTCCGIGKEVPHINRLHGTAQARPVSPIVTRWRVSVD